MSPSWEEFEASRRTLQEPGKKEVIRFASHRLTTTRHPVVDLTVSGVRLYSAHFTVTVNFDVDLAVGVIEQGKLTPIPIGDDPRAVVAVAWSLIFETS